MKLTALLYFVLSLLGLDVGRSTVVDRISIDGVQAVYSRATVEAGVARFECVRSRSGHCYYTLFPGDCATPSGQRSPTCLDAPLQRFAVADGNTRQIVGLRAFRVCVSDHDATPDAGCRALEPAATR